METMFSQMQQFMTDLAEVTRSNLARWDAMLPDVQKAQDQGVRRIDAAIDEAAQWGKQSIAMWAEVSRASFAMVRHGLESAMPRQPGA
jgi:hypothetical protein